MSIDKKSSAKNQTSKVTNANHHDGILLFDKSNYTIMIIGIAIILVGFICMMGGKSPNPNEFHPEILYSFARVTLGPMLILVGFGVEIYAIFFKKKS
jgi:hypothetical protein